MGRSGAFLVAGLTLGGLAVSGGAGAQDAFPEPEKCPRLVAAAPAVILASATAVTETVGEGVSIFYVGHSTFLIESPAGVTIATDYNDAVRPRVTPDVATMNRAHISHYSVASDAGITHLLKGWGTADAPASYDLTIRDVWLRNVTTNIRGGFDSFDVQRDMNSIFVFEVSGLCIAHLGHLHHKLTDDHLKALGRIDVVLAPVDGSRTLNTVDMIAVLRDIGAPVVIPMHYFGFATLNRFMKLLEKYYAVEISDTPTVTLSRDSLPRIPTLLILPPG